MQGFCTEDVPEGVGLSPTSSGKNKKTLKFGTGEQTRPSYPCIWDGSALMTEMIDRRQLQDTFGNWLSQYPWNFWATLTFRFKVEKTLNAKRYFHRWLSQVSKKYGVRPSYFFAVEFFASGESNHIHSLLYLPHNDLFHKNPYIEPAWRMWFERYGRARIEVYDPGKGARYYLAKYITKDIHDWDFEFNT